MNVPKLTTEERLEALEKAKKARLERAEIKEKIKTGELSLEEVMDMKYDPVIGRMRISALIETMPGVGKLKVERIMKECNISESRRIRGLGDKQRKALLERLERYR